MAGRAHGVMAPGWSSACMRLLTLLSRRTFMSALMPHASDMLSAVAGPMPNTLRRAMWKLALCGSAVRAICVVMAAL